MQKAKFKMEFGVVINSFESVNCNFAFFTLRFERSTSMQEGGG